MYRFKNLKIGYKLLLSFGFMIICAITIVTINIRNMRLITQEFVALNETVYQYLANQDVDSIFLSNLNDNIYEIANRSYQIRITTIIVSVSATTIALIFAAIVSVAIVKPLRKITYILKDVSKGKLDAEVSIVSLDETGILAQASKDIVSSLNNLISDLSHMSDQQAIGNTDTYVDSAKYHGAYAIVVDKINQMTKSTTTLLFSLANVFLEISNGSFDTNFVQQPGNLAKLNDSVENMRKNIIQISNEVKAVTQAAANGNLDVSIDASQYDGGWLEIMVGLNSITSAIDVPLKVLALAMTEMREGNFDITDIDRKLVDAGFDSNVNMYNGVFKDIIAHFEETLIDIHSYIDELRDILGQMAGGDLTTQISREYVGDFDIIKNSINNIITSLHKTISEISIASDQVFQGANQITTSAAELSSGAQEQASSVEELNATIDIINQQTQQNAENALTANELSNKSAINAQEGNEAMKQMVEAMTQIKVSSNDISMIVKTIQDIAFKTNLLALNASVEAARAGEHGKGFSVVADEVRSLAERSQTATTETTDLIQASINHVESGSDIAEKTAESLNAIVTSASEVLAIISSISVASKEQAEAITQVSFGLAQVAKVTQTNSAVSEETAAASEELNSQAEVLRELVEFFKL